MDCAVKERTAGMRGERARTTYVLAGRHRHRREYLHRTSSRGSNLLPAILARGRPRRAVGLSGPPCTPGSARGDAPRALPRCSAPGAFCRAVMGGRRCGAALDVVASRTRRRSTRRARATGVRRPGPRSPRWGSGATSAVAHRGRRRAVHAGVVHPAVHGGVHAGRRRRGGRRRVGDAQRVHLHGVELLLGLVGAGRVAAGEEHALVVDEDLHDRDGARRDAPRSSPS